MERGQDEEEEHLKDVKKMESPIKKLFAAESSEMGISLLGGWVGDQR
jgi:hypothetical protein